MYVELHACSAFSFLRGGSFPEHLAATAASLEMPAVALLDRDGVYGAQRFSVAARENGVRKCPAFAVGYPQYFIRGSSAPKCRRNTANANIASRQIALLATTFPAKKTLNSPALTNGLQIFRRNFRFSFHSDQTAGIAQGQTGDV